MKTKLIIYPIILTAFLAMTGCDSFSRLKENALRISQLEAVERRLAEAQQNLTDQLNANRQIEKGRSTWRIVSAALVVLAAVTLFTGAVLGSEARKEAES